jgi:hypothetical protein
MRRLEFHAHVLTEKDVRRGQRRSYSLRPFAGRHTSIPGAIFIALAALYVCREYLQYHGRFVSSGYTAVLGDQRFTARNVLLLLDVSFSMGGTKATLDRQIEQMLKAGITIDARSESWGFGFNLADPYNALNKLEAALRTNPAVDAIYLFSDFDPGALDYSDEAGYARLRQLLREGRRRLYLGTVRLEPDARLLQIARESRGGLITEKVK